MINVQEPYLAVYGNPKLLSFCFAGVDSNSLWSTYEEQNLIIAELWQEIQSALRVLISRRQWGRPVHLCHQLCGSWLAPGESPCPLTACPTTKPLSSLLRESLFVGDAGKRSFLYDGKISYWGQIYRKCIVALRDWTRESGKTWRVQSFCINCRSLVCLGLDCLNQLLCWDDRKVIFAPILPC